MQHRLEVLADLVEPAHVTLARLMQLTSVLVTGAGPEYGGQAGSLSTLHRLRSAGVSLAMSLHSLAERRYALQSSTEGQRPHRWRSGFLLLVVRCIDCQHW